MYDQTEIKVVVKVLSQGMLFGDDTCRNKCINEYGAIALTPVELIVVNAKQAIDFFVGKKLELLLKETGDLHIDDLELILQHENTVRKEVILKKLRDVALGPVYERRFSSRAASFLAKSREVHKYTGEEGSMLRDAPKDRLRPRPAITFCATNTSTSSMSALHQAEEVLQQVSIHRKNSAMHIFCGDLNSLKPLSKDQIIGTETTALNPNPDSRSLESSRTNDAAKLKSTEKLTAVAGPGVRNETVLKPSRLKSVESPQSTLSLIKVPLKSKRSCSFLTRPSLGKNMSVEIDTERNRKVSLSNSFVPRKFSSVVPTDHSTPITSPNVNISPSRRESTNHGGFRRVSTASNPRRISALIRKYTTPLPSKNEECVSAKTRETTKEASANFNCLTSSDNDPSLSMLSLYNF